MSAPLRRVRGSIRADILRRMIRTGAHARAEKLLERMAAADIADVFPSLGPGERQTLINLLFATQRAGRTLSELPEEILSEVLEKIDDLKLATILERVEPDDAAYFLEAVDEERRPKVLSRLDPKKRLDIERVLGSPEESAGAVMTTRITSVPQTATCEEAIEQIRSLADAVDEVFYIYATDEDGRLTGVVPIRKLLVSPKARPISDVMIPDPVAIREDADQEEAADLVAKYNLLALPVVDAEGRILGAITVDDVIDVIHEEATEDMYRMVGLEGEDRIFTPWSESFRRRLPWMILNLGTAFLAATVVGVFEDSIAQVVALAVFMPIVAGMGGNVGTQTLTVVTRAIAMGDAELVSLAAAVGRQVGVSFAIGTTTGLLTGLVAFLWQGNLYLGMVLFLAMVLNMVIAGVVGAGVPIVLTRLKKDPAVGSGVLVTTFTDVGGFFAFLGLATLFIENLR